METFDWEKCEQTRNKRVYNYYLANFDQKLSEDQYAEDMWLLQKASHSKDVDKRSHRKRKRSWARNGRRREYRHLQEKFGFFKGV